MNKESQSQNNYNHTNTNKHTQTKRLQIAMLSLQQRKAIVEKENSEITSLCEDLMQKEQSKKT